MIIKRDSPAFSKAACIRSNVLVNQGLAPCFNCYEAMESLDLGKKRENVICDSCLSNKENFFKRAFLGAPFETTRTEAEFFTYPKEVLEWCLDEEL